MRKLNQNFFWLGVLVFGLQTSWAFSLLGPLPTYSGLPGNFSDTWQVPTIGYNLNSDIGGPVNIGEGYRLNVPVIYYACDGSFLNYFGQAGLTNIDAAFNILNSITNASSINLNAYPYSAEFENATAHSLSLRDLKSATLRMLLEHMGLADPQRYVWTLRDRYPDPNNPCPTNVYYLVVQRNFDPVTIAQSAYINGDLYTYQIYEDCGNFNSAYDAITENFNTSGNNFDGPIAGDGLGRSGDFFTGLTYDDVGALKYLLSSNNVVNEDVFANGNNFTTTLLATNIGAITPTPLITSDLGALIAASKTNDPVTLMGLFPGLVANGVATNYSVAWITNTTYYYTVPIGEPVGSPPTQLNSISTVTPTLLTSYVTTFANVVTNHYYPNTVTAVTSVTVKTANGAPYGSGLLTTNVTSSTVVLSNVPSGDYYLIPTNVWGYVVNSVLLTNQVITTNIIVSTNYSSGNSSLSILTYATNYWLLVQPLNQTFSTPTNGLHQGVEHIQYLRTAYDSLLGQTFTPITNTYTMVKLLNYKLVTEVYQRVLTGPDIVLSAADLNASLGAAFDPNNNNYGALTRSPNIFDVNQISPGLSGPGVITPATQITFNTAGLFFVNNSGFNPLSTNYTSFTGNTNAAPNGTFGVQWASFDLSTNIVVYPSSTSLADLQAAELMQVSPASLPDATNGVPYSATFTATGGEPPYTWSSPDLSVNVPGLTIDPNTGVLSGTPTVSGTTNFTVQVTFSQNQTVNWIYFLNVQ